MFHLLRVNFNMCNSVKIIQVMNYLRDRSALVPRPFDSCHFDRSMIRNRNETITFVELLYCYYCILIEMAYPGFKTVHTMRIPNGIGANNNVIAIDFG